MPVDQRCQRAFSFDDVTLYVVARRFGAFSCFERNNRALIQHVITNARLADVRISWQSGILSMPSPYVTKDSRPLVCSFFKLHFLKTRIDLL